MNEVYTNLRDLGDPIRADVVGLESAIAELVDDIENCNLRIREAELILNASSEAVDYWKNVLETAYLTHRVVDEKHKLAVMSIISDRQDLINLFPSVPPIKPSGVPRLVLIFMTPLLAMVLFLAALFLVEVLKVSLKP